MVSEEEEEEQISEKQSKNTHQLASPFSLLQLQSLLLCSKNKIIYLICNNAISVPKLYNINHHYEQHKSKYDNYEGLMRQKS
ncbi:hypothetical protein QTO34_018714 [Cnephaeus nilssonii]|uniref:Uncharacterized protein n=1 Tax=Cnephaeus nilssonii TaxID=3371016 RepID=A0AA40HZF2_CNENI|nr:hypothetical protein QTO34_018714 [Eptesicus nilssonii]